MQHHLPPPAASTPSPLSQLTWRQYETLVRFIYVRWHTLAPIEQLIAGVLIDGNLTIAEARTLVFGKDERRSIRRGLPMMATLAATGVPYQQGTTPSAPADDQKIRLQAWTMSALCRRATVASRTVGLTTSTPLFFDASTPGTPMSEDALRSLAEAVFSRALGQPTSAEAHLNVIDVPKTKDLQQELDFTTPLPSSSGASLPTAA